MFTAFSLLCLSLTSAQDLTCTQDQLDMCKRMMSDSCVASDTQRCVPECALDEDPARTKNCCYTCKEAPAEGCESFDRSTCPRPEPCRDGQEPMPLTDYPCCKDCVPNVDDACTDQQKRECAAKVLPLCADDTTPTFVKEDCCFDCRVDQTTVDPKPCEDWSNIPECRDGQYPVIQDATGCPDCYKPRDECTQTQREACKDLQIPTCADEVRPELLDCCPTCIAPQPCSQEEIDTCKRGYADLRECAQDERQFWDDATCCYNCREPAPVEDRPDPTTEDCTREQMKRCTLNQPYCKPGEEPIFSKERCCGSCNPEYLFRCDEIDIARCLKAQPYCRDGERPQAVEGLCCKTCKLADPVCDPACDADTAKCVFTAKDRSTTGCATRERLEAKLEATTAHRTDQFKEFVADLDICTYTLRALVEKACQRYDFQERCAEYLEYVYRVECTRVKDNGDTVDLTVEVPDRTMEPRRRLQDMHGDSASHLLDNMLNDPDFYSGVTVTENEGSSASSLVPAMTVLVALAMSLLL